MRHKHHQHSEAYQRGAFAALRDEHQRNPYPSGTPEHDDWYRGWRAYNKPLDAMARVADDEADVVAAHEARYRSGALRREAQARERDNATHG